MVSWCVKKLAVRLQKLTVDSNFWLLNSMGMNRCHPIFDFRLKSDLKSHIRALEHTGIKTHDLQVVMYA